MTHAIISLKVEVRILWPSVREGGHPLPLVTCLPVLLQPLSEIKLSMPLKLGHSHINFPSKLKFLDRTLYIRI